MQIFRKRIDDDYSFRYIVAVFCVICLVLGLGCYRYYTQIQSTMKEENEHYLKEISTRIVNNISSTIDNNFSVLETLSSVILESKPTTFSQIEPIIRDQIEYWPFDNVLMIDASGVAYDADMNKISITGDSFLRALSKDEQSIFTSQVINHEDRLVFTSPLNNVTMDGKEIIAIATTYDPKEFDEILAMESFDAQSYSQIVTIQGNIAVRSNADVAEDFGYNILHSIQLMDSASTKDVEILKQNMIEDKSGQFEFNINGNKQYLVYTPIASQPWYLFTFVPVSIVSEKSTLLLKSTLIICCFAVLMFAALISVLVLSFQKHKKKLEKIAYVDPLTKGNTLQRFFELAQYEMDNHTQHSALIYTNIQRFKVLNDQMGRLVCDQIIATMQKAIQSDLHENECVGHYTADNFSVLLTFHEKEELLERFAHWHSNLQSIAEQQHILLPSFTLTFGVYLLEDKEIQIQDMLDRARVALRESSTMSMLSDNVYYSFYDDEVRHRMIKEKHLEDMMDKALREQEFQVYLQPKFEIKENKIAGAEALVRWFSKSDGMIFPDSFIPLFERNGFIVKLDLWMFEQVCALLKKWMDEGKELVKISVNCSRVHLKNENFLDEYNKIFQKYHIPAKYLELELTENMVFENTEQLARVIDHIHALGFGCSMDDFGSGYSSLNLLQNIHVDTLKLDRIFFKNEFEKKPRNKAIIDCILQMAQSLSMQTVAEGVEEQDQVDALRILGCDYIQGYVYARPMPVPEFEQMLFEGSEKKVKK